MPRVSLYQPGQIQRQGPTDAKFRAADHGPGIGEGIQTLGRAGAVAAEAETRIQEIRAEEEARRLDVDHMDGLRTFRTRVRSARGIAARQTVAEATTELADYNRQFLSRASTPLARQMLDRSIHQRTSQEMDSWENYAVEQEGRAIDAGHEARASSFIETALDHAEEPEIARTNLDAAVNEIRQRGQFNGWDEATTESQILAARSAFHVGRARQRFEADDPEGAREILDLNRGEITAADEASMRRMISGDLQANEAEADAALALSGATAPDAAASAPTGRPVEGQAAVTSFKARVRGAESSGDDGANNPRSSASGRYQFTDGTFNSYFQRVYGRAPRAGERNDPQVQERLMTALTNDNQAALRRGGRPVTEGNLYLLHFAGEGGGMALLNAAPNTPAERVLGSAVINANPHLRGMTASDVIAWANRRMGGTNEARLPAPDGTRVDLDTAYARIEAQPWSESRKRRAREAIQRYAGQNDQIQERNWQDADRAIGAALDTIARGGGRLTSLSQLPAGALANARPGMIENLQTSIRQNNRAEDAVPNSPTMNNLIVQAAEDPNAFLRIVPEAYRGQITGAEVQQLTQMQLTIRNRAGPQPSQLLNMIRFVLPTTGLVPDVPTGGSARARREATQQRVQTQRNIEGRLLAAVQYRLQQRMGHAEITQNDILAAVRAEVSAVNVNGHPMRVFEAREQGATRYNVPIPAHVVPYVDEALRRLGLPITDNNRGNAYLDHRADFDAAAERAAARGRTR